MLSDADDVIDDELVAMDIGETRSTLLPMCFPFLLSKAQWTHICNVWSSLCGIVNFAACIICGTVIIGACLVDCSILSVTSPLHGQVQVIFLCCMLCEGRS